MACSGGMVKDKDGFAHRRPIEVIWTRDPRELVSKLLDGVGGYGLHDGQSERYRQRGGKRKKI